jgi:hypothetical protein
MFITLDMDWACDEVTLFAAELLESANLKATFFITHDTPILKYLRSNPKFELGLHPDFNPLLTGETHHSAAQILASLKTIVPEAVSVRTHALVGGTLLSRLYFKKGLTHESSIYYHVTDGRIPKPYYDINGMLKILHFWEDDCHISLLEQGKEQDWDVNRFLSYEGIKVFDFHPIHLFVNTAETAHYQLIRPYNKDPDRLRKHINRQTAGALTFFKDLSAAIKQYGMETGNLFEINLLR